MEENRKVRFAVVGSGHIGKRHAEMIRRNPEAELIAMCDIQPKENIGLADLEVPFFHSMDELFASSQRLARRTYAESPGEKEKCGDRKTDGTHRSRLRKDHLQSASGLKAGFLRHAKPVFSSVNLDKGCD